MEDFCKEELKNISDRVTNIVPRIRSDFLQYSHQLTLDLNTHLPETILAEKDDNSSVVRSMKHAICKN
ncbi:hypothetical protein QQF64_023994 [Cirrhinus molitorella]|uniref:Uncharacterized protein n=1 Tax=Cirrhinus molitorella TaxID=172907 RepID=A0ABR3NKM3_9TELE